MAGSGRGSAKRGRGIALLRGAGFALAVALGGVAVWLIVTSTSQKRIEIGILTGLWGLLLGSYSVFGSRAPQREPEPAPAPLRPLAAAGRELDVRQIGEIERAAVAAARREFQAELEQMLRREVQAGLASEVAGLRSEVAALRNELVEKVGGQLRLERIETTRLIGSDLEALQHELRQLRHVGGPDFDEFDERFGKSLPQGAGVPATVSVAKVAEGAPALPPTSRVPDIHDAEIVQELEIVPERAAVPERAVERQPEPAPEPAVEPERAVVPEPVAVPEPAPEPQPEVVAEPAPVAEHAPVSSREPAEAVESLQREHPAAADPFASMPRLSRFTDFELDSVPADGTSDGASRGSGRHSTDDNPSRRVGRRHRADDSENDTLARILARENR